jgi:hypothetical protein
MAPCILYSDLKILNTVRVGMHGQKPPVQIRLLLDAADAELLTAGPVFKHKVCRKILYLVILISCKSPTSLISAPIATLEYPQGLSVYINESIVQNIPLPHFGLDLTSRIIGRSVNQIRISFYATGPSVL